MSILTTPSEHGTGYSVAAEDIPKVIAKLGKIEHKAFDLFEEVCDNICRHTARYKAHECSAEAVEAYCADCPLSQLDRMISR